ncbi:MAG: flavodoxin domain-containing protein [Treponemataceae bacterium]|nr:flavodoxin domain-containing protein [Treponemataceae bacterium]
MKTAVIFSSETGFTKKYAEWLKEALGNEAELFALNEARKALKDSWNDFDALIYGGWCCAGSVNGASWFKKNISDWAAAGKKLAVWATGGSPAGSPVIEVTLNRLLAEEQHKVCEVFYCPGGYAYDKMSAKNRMLMGLFAKMVENKAKKDPSLKEMAKMLSQSYDLTDKKYIEPILKYLEQK